MIAILGMFWYIQYIKYIIELGTCLCIQKEVIFLNKVNAYFVSRKRNEDFNE